MEDIYELYWEFDHLVDMDEDCSVVPFDGIENFRFQLGGINLLTPKIPIILRGNFNIIPQHTDFPIVDLGLPLMSKNMIFILEQDIQVKLNKIDTTILDDTYLGKIFDNCGNILSDIKKNNDYQFIQVLDYLQAFDYENSIFKPLRSMPEKVGVINKLVLKKPVKGFPSIFRISEKPSMLFVNGSTKLIFEKNGIKGCTFNWIPVS